MRALFKVLEWIIVAGFLGFIVYTAFVPKPGPEYHPEAWHDWEGFMAISYSGITRSGGDNEEYVSPSRLSEHLEALHDAGYKTVRQEDLVDFLEGKTPLPERALFILFEHGRRDSFIRATPRLRKYRMGATMAAATAHADTRNRNFLTRGEIKKGSRLAEWEFASMGHNAEKTIQVDPEGHEGHFLTSLEWQGEALEPSADWEQRVRLDYDKAAALLKKLTHKPVQAYLYPFADTGAGPNAHPRAEAVNLDAVQRVHELAFAGAYEPYNGPRANPFRLTRLRVSQNWSGQDLLNMLEESRPRLEPVEGFQTATWNLRKGAAIGDAGLDLPDDSFGTIRGSDNWTDTEVSATLARDKGGVAAVYARYRDHDHFLRAVLEPGGIRIQEQLNGRLRGLAFVARPTGSDPVQLTLRVRQNRAWAYLDGEKVAGPLPVSPSLQTGLVGVSAENAGCKATSFEARPLKEYTVYTEDWKELPAEKISSATTWMLPWLEAGQEPGFSSAQRRDILRLARDGASVIPVIRVGDGFDPIQSAAFAALLRRNLDEAMLGGIIRSVAIEGFYPELAHELRAQGFQITHLLYPGEARESLETAAWHGDHLAVELPEDMDTDFLQEVLRQVPAYRTTLLTDRDIALPFGMHSGTVVGNLAMKGGTP